MGKKSKLHPGKVLHLFSEIQNSIHFFTGATVRVQNSLVEKGFGYVHEISYSPEWLVKEHLPDSTPYSQVEGRIKESRKQEKRVWDKLSYNCEHWARHMFCGEPRCTQLEKLRRKNSDDRSSIS